MVRQVVVEAAVGAVDGSLFLNLSHRTPAPVVINEKEGKKQDFMTLQGFMRTSQTLSALTSSKIDVSKDRKLD